ncbi:hypothetical protein DPMN_051741 [Dreissena polymorpha]|uniref:Uncharacterized protein n=1 Tax=Dreissena polymorpha TaxID=45954 RepID=A0A9D4CK25_DREPO|nr:hypothetical protein DPMN_051741 [Dreissena polymorpha]
MLEELENASATQATTSMQLKRYVCLCATIMMTALHFTLKVSAMLEELEHASATQATTLTQLKRNVCLTVVLFR